MERKLVKQGRNSLTMTLPSDWIKKNNLTQEDCVYIKEEKNQLLIFSNEEKREKKSVELNIKNMKRGLAFHLVIGKYIEGYDRIILKHNNPILAQKIGTQFIGMIIEEHDDEKTIIKDIIKVPEENFVSIFKRACQLLIQQTKTLKKRINNEAEHEDVKAEERLLDYNIFYCLRYISKYEKLENSYKYFLLCTTIESIGDILSKISSHYKPKDKQTVEQTIEIIEQYITYLFTKNIEKMYWSVKDFKSKIKRDSFVDGLSYSIAENLYNYIGYIKEKSS